jgi:hypothetical protein
MLFPPPPPDFSSVPKLTSQSRVLLEKLIITQQVKKITALY